MFITITCSFLPLTFSVLKAQHFDSHTSVEDVAFPQQGDVLNFSVSSMPAQVTIPAAVLKERMNSSKGTAPIKFA